MARRTNKVVMEPAFISEPITYITMSRITVNSTGQIFEKYSPFPYGLEGVDYEKLLSSKLIKTLADFQQIDTGRCLTCGD